MLSKYRVFKLDPRDIVDLKLASKPFDQTDVQYMQTNATFVPTCWAQHIAFVCTPCWAMLQYVAFSLKPVKLFAQHMPPFLLFFSDR